MMARTPNGKLAIFGIFAFAFVLCSELYYGLGSHFTSLALKSKDSISKSLHAEAKKIVYNVDVVNRSCMTSMDYEAEKNKTVEKFMNENTKQDDPAFIRMLQTYFLEFPKASPMLRNTRPVSKTSQAQKVDQLLKYKRNGFFVEAGAFDGEVASNTIYLEQTRGWYGLLIEMDPGMFLQLKGKQRRAVMSGACISPKGHPVKGKILYNQYVSQATKLILGDTGNLHLQDVNCFPLFSFLLALGHLDIDYLSLDIEGHEFDVLQTIPFDLLHIKIISVEYMHGRANKQMYIDFMALKGYTLHTELTKCNHFCRDFIFVKLAWI